MFCSYYTWLRLFLIIILKELVASYWTLHMLSYYIQQTLDTTGINACIYHFILHSVPHWRLQTDVIPCFHFSLPTASFYTQSRIENHLQMFSWASVWYSLPHQLSTAQEWSTLMFYQGPAFSLSLCQIISFQWPVIVSNCFVLHQVFLYGRSCIFVFYTPTVL